MHVATSQLLHFTLATIINARSASNAATVERLIADMGGAQTAEDFDMKGALFAIDRGYMTKETVRAMESMNCNFQMRTREAKFG